MTNTDQIHPPQDELREVAAADARLIWERIGYGLARYADCKVTALLETMDGGDPEKKQPDDNPLVRKISAIVIAAQRTLELENSYGQKVQHRGEAADYREEARRQLAQYDDEVRDYLARLGVDRALVEKVEGQ